MNLKLIQRILIGMLFIQILTCIGLVVVGVALNAVSGNPDVSTFRR